jgi:beta-glucanase (GH16 family)
VLRADGTPWTCVVSDEFNGTQLDPAIWHVLTTPESGYTVGGECFTNSARNVSVANGALRLTVRRESLSVLCASSAGLWLTPFTGAMVTTNSKMAWSYGRFEIRAAFPAARVAGLHSALWLWPQNPTYYGPRPASGEIDIAEFYTRYPDRVIPFLHYKHTLPDPNVTNNYCMVSHPEQFHTYVLERTPASIKVTYDGATCLLDTHWWPDGLTMPAPFDRPFFLNLTQATDSFGSNARTSATPFPATTTIDYVHIWS